jgi:glycosyltransferase involved in cell wall biosynthesis
VRFVVVGKTDMEPEYMSSVRDVVESRGIDSDVVFTGFVPDDDIPVFYNLADVFVLPSFEEGSSIAVTEAIASGTPVVGSRIDGIRQQIDDGIHGRLVAPGDVEGLATALEEVLADDETRGTMARALEARAEELSWPLITERIVDVYEGING